MSVRHAENKLWNRFISKISILNLYLFTFHVNCFLAICKFLPVTSRKEVIIWLLLIPPLNLQVQISLIQFWKLVLNCRFIHMISNIIKCRIKSAVCRWWYGRTMKQFIFDVYPDVSSQLTYVLNSFTIKLMNEKMSLDKHFVKKIHQ